MSGASSSCRFHKELIADGRSALAQYVGEIFRQRDLLDDASREDDADGELQERRSKARGFLPPRRVDELVASFRPRNGFGPDVDLLRKALAEVATRRGAEKALLAVRDAHEALLDAWRDGKPLDILIQPHDSAIGDLILYLPEPPAAGGPNPPSDPSNEIDGQPAEPAGVATTAKKRKRSTERGEGRAKLIAGLTKHHQYDGDSCGNQNPIGNNELARLAQVDKATASVFFKAEFKGYVKYRAACMDVSRLLMVLKLLNQDFPAHTLLFGRNPPSEGKPDEE